MKKILMISAVLMLNLAYSQSPIYTKAKVVAVKVYNTSADLENSVQFNLPQGTSEVVISNISEEMIDKSLQMSFNVKNISVLSSQYTNSYTEKLKIDTKNPEIKKVLDSISLVENLLSKNNINLETTKKTLELLDKNQMVLVGGGNASVNSLQQLTDFYAQKRTDLSQKMVNLNLEKDQLSTKISNLKNSLKTKQQKQEEDLAGGKLVLKLQTSKAINVKMKLNYLVSRVYWNLFYDIKSQGISSPLVFSVKASLKQETGIDWKGVKLSLIGGESSANKQAPMVSPWFLYSYKPQRVKSMATAKTQETAKEVSLEDENQELHEVVVQSFSSTQNKLNTTYQTPILYDVLSDEDEILIDLFVKEIPAKYEYFTAPSYSEQAFLVANVKDFASYELSSGGASVIFEDTFVGETYINASQTETDLRITLGTDPKISIKKEKVADKSGEKFLSLYKEKTITYDIIIKNNKNEKVDILVQDRYPLSDNEDIKVEILEDTSAEKNTEKGFLFWNVKLSENQQKKIRVSYKVRYPKEMNVHI